MTGTDHAWNAYWRQPRLAACLRNEEGNYGGAIAEEWTAFFSGLEKGARILDLATGNGAIALMALEISDRLGLAFSIAGADAAEISPADALPELRRQLQRIEFIGNARCESLPFQDGAFDAVCGQYALEYSDLGRTIPEIARVLRPGGELMFIAHTTDSGVFATTAAQLRDIAALAPLRLVSRVIEMVRAETDARRDDLAIAREAFNRNAARAMGRLEDSSGYSRTFISQYLQQMGEIYQSRGKQQPEETILRLRQLDRDLGTHEARLHSLVNAALSVEEVESRLVNLRELDFKIVASREVFGQETGGKLGHLVRARLGR